MIIGVEGLVGLHIAISLVALAAGFMVLAGFLTGTWARGQHHLFLLTTVATSVSGFFLPARTVLPSHVTGIVSLLVLAVALYAFYGARLTGRWRKIYVGMATAALYLNVFVLIVQTFVKNPTLLALAPMQSEPPFAVAQVLVLLAFVLVGYRAVSRAGGTGA